MKLGQSVGPAGVLVWAGNPNRSREEWLAVRPTGIGSSDAALIAVPSKWGNALTVYEDKVNWDSKRDTAGEAAEWGTILEDPIARRWSEVHGLKIQRIGIVAHRHERWIKASLDRRVLRCPDGPCGLEIKCRSEWKSGQWSDDVPDDVLAQTQWQMLATGFRHMHVSVLIGGNRQKHYRVEAIDEVQAFIHDLAAEVWACVQAGTPPEIDPEDADRRVVEALDRLFAHITGATEVDEAAGRKYLARYVRALEVEKAASKRKEQAQAALAVLMGGHDVATIGGSPAWTRTPQSRTFVDAKALKDVAPEVYRQVSETRPIAPRFQIKSGFDPRKQTTT